MTGKKTGTTGKKAGTKNEKSIGKYVTVILTVAAVISFMLLIGTLYGHSDELLNRYFGNRIVAEYHEEEGNVFATYQDENDVLHTFDLRSYYPVHEGNTINLYYSTVIDDAIPENTMFSWIKYYIIYGGIFVLSMWQVRKRTGSE